MQENFRMGRNVSKRFPFMGLQVLLVDQNPFTRRLIIQVLRAFGANDVREVMDGAEALREIRAHKPDVVLTEYHLTPVDGLEFTKILRTSHDSPAPTLPVVMVTSYTSVHHVQAARDAGVTEFMAKPITALGLYVRISAALKHNRPFIRDRRFTGPDRRRSRRGKDYGGPARRGEEGDDVPPGEARAG